MNHKQRRAQAANQAIVCRKAGGSRLRHELNVANRRILDAKKKQLAAFFLALSPDRSDPLRGELSRSMSISKETDELTDDDIVGLLTEGYEQGAMLAARLQGEEPGFAFEDCQTTLQQDWQSVVCLREHLIELPLRMAVFVAAWI